MTRRATWTALSAAAVALVAVSAAKPWQPALLWNATASTPIGLYRLHALGPLHDDELVAAMPPPGIASFLARGGFLPRGVPLLKHIAALPGQTVCRTGDIVTIDGETVGLALNRDHLGRPLPRWRGCRQLIPGQVFLMNTRVWDSLDGRYFGPFPARSIIGQAVPIWIKHAPASAAMKPHGSAPATSPSTTKGRSS